MKAKTKTEGGLDCMRQWRHVVISDSLCGRDTVLLFICNTFLSCGFWGKDIIILTSPDVNHSVFALNTKPLSLKCLSQ